MSGLIMVPIFIFYVVVSFFILWFISKKLFPKVKPFKLGSIVLILVLIFPFWDLIVLKTIKEVYAFTHENPIIYEQIEFDKNGKYESLAILDSPDDTDRLKKTIPTNEFYKQMFNLVNSHIEFLVLDKDTKQKIILKISKIEDSKYKFDSVVKSEARYTLIWKDGTSNWFFSTSFYQVIDTKNKIIMGEVYMLNLYPNKIMKYIRDNCLLMVSAGGGRSMVSVRGLNYVDDIALLRSLRLIKKVTK